MTNTKLLTSVVQAFHRASRLGDSEVSAYWLNRFHDLLDEAEANGMGLDIPLPRLAPVFPGMTYPRMTIGGLRPGDWPSRAIAWGQDHRPGSLD